VPARSDHNVTGDCGVGMGDGNRMVINDPSIFGNDGAVGAAGQTPNIA
jgi:hypothetical protein